eukprot:gnl/Chilomastix_caulleri/3113.p2 GENE.gnl/Chilomastix_caulleri/3113~~gnl/Chilomastix_caulleri/3113.p2  ORF type:complete len:75 (+),score=31.87 gnl/Chilomastix_caulleri/3113:273-497(+)
MPVACWGCTHMAQSMGQGLWGEGDMNGSMMGSVMAVALVAAGTEEAKRGMGDEREDGGENEDDDDDMGRLWLKF